MVVYMHGRIVLVGIRQNTMLLRGSRSKQLEVPELENASGYEAVQERNLDV